MRPARALAGLAPIAAAVARGRVRREMEAANARLGAAAALLARHGA